MAHQNTLRMLVVLEPKSGQADKVISELQKIVEPSRAEPGNIEYRLHRTTEGAVKVILFEQWKDRAILDEHLKTAHYQQFAKTCEPLLEKPVLQSITFLEAVDPA